mmetsp:Transcript_35762/g.43165  ORF Transcript_35762/g.43165 Transcript_35762/m.43165 type:complete len:509 (+) Transcript_35762:270-1796(+)|eukprot:CAMPEP_0197863026 /NCGR_PEP_ID=MMETSP1438-20131217/40186_1 /TAXON_ID=1461541 /ORGANISM="Pterosperma sp., Strain CCMP1384" /LENGTH=508 /DNA_ID=CAMNT_0043480767 /DNA_START=258 /DNA_END=1784 /DNA_ORIENTATION=+
MSHEPNTVQPLAQGHDASQAANGTAKKRWHVAGAAASLAGRALEKGSLRASVITLCSSAAGTGVLALPHAFANCGLVLGTVITIAAGVMNAYVCRLLVHACEGTQSRMYEEISVTLYGRASKTVLDVLQLFTLFGVSTALMIVCGDTFTSALPSDALEHVFGTHCARNSVSGDLPKDCVALATFPLILLFVLPLALMRDFSSLRYTNALSVCSVMLVLVTLAANARDPSSAISTKPSDHIEGHDTGLKAHHAHNLARLLFNFSSDVLVAIPVITMSFACQFNVPGIYNELKDRNTRKMDEVLFNSTFFLCILYCGIGIGGALTVPVSQWDDGFPGDILADDGSTSARAGWQNALMACARVAMCLVSIVVLPLMTLPMRSVLHYLMFQQESANATQTMHVAETVGLLGCAFGLSIIIPFLDFMVGITSSTSGVFLLTIAPTLFYLKLQARNHVSCPDAEYLLMEGQSGTPQQTKKSFITEKFIPYLTILIGVLILVMSTTFTLKTQFEK